MPVSKISKLVQAEAEAAMESATVQAFQAGLSIQEAQAIADSIAVADAEKKAKESILPADGRKFVRQEIKVDQFNVLRRYVELKPSMCKERGCAFDAAKSVGYIGGWDDDRFDKNQMLDTGRTMEQAVLSILDAHMRSYHVFDTTAHIISEEELKKRGGWTNVPPTFLTGAR